MSFKLKEKREQLGRLWDEYKAFRDSLPNDESLWSGEQKERFDRLDADCDRLESEIRRLEKDAGRENRFHQPDGSFTPDPLDDDQGDVSFRGDKGGFVICRPGERRSLPTVGRRNVPEDAFDHYLRHGERGLSASEFRAFQADSDVEGGYLVAPQKMANDLVMAAEQEVFIMSWAHRLYIPKAASLGVVNLDTDAEDWDWTTELATGNEEDSIRFGKRQLFPHPVAKRVKVSQTLIRGSGRAQTIIVGRMGYKLALTFENGFLTGDGSQKPLGLFVASDDGIPTARDVSTGNSTTAIQADGLIEAKHTLRPPYRKRARWLFHPDSVKMIRKMKDGEGQYLWQPGLVADQVDKILGLPYGESELAPNTFTSGNYVGLVGDFSYYWIAIALDVKIQVLTELYAETNQIGYIGRAEVDAQPVLGEAFARVTLA
ncbi:phage capsid protein [Desulfosarcina widdelii]|uniref:Phage capsid protein n=1 Tax=Desulfosarcina widdelii TaxID=947919 RepID=A0A5K7Z4E0_9BACT|nr:phage major capsid protein [Desulfosarcina widdelii]BBO73344.1 phage capsid protein [Desulfosarcina widdelii]